MIEPDRRRQRGERARAQVLEHSTAIASTEGLEGLSIGRVAAEAGIGKGNIQVLFGDKEALQLATLESAVALYHRNVVDRAMQELTPAARLEALVDGWFGFVEMRILPGGCFINAVSSEYRARPGRVRDRINEHRKEIRSRFTDLIHASQKADELRADLDVEQMVFELVAYQAAANVASLMGDSDEFSRARASSIDRVRFAKLGITEMAVMDAADTDVSGPDIRFLSASGSGDR
jgi:AcrR family transcriptional regulator